MQRKNHVSDVQITKYYSKKMFEIIVNQKFCENMVL